MSDQVPRPVPTEPGQEPGVARTSAQGEAAAATSSAPATSGATAPTPAPGAASGAGATSASATLAAEAPAGSGFMAPAEDDSFDDSSLLGEKYAATPRFPNLLRRPLARGVLAYLLLALLAGLVCAPLWKALTTLPTYTLAADGSGVASTSERGLAAFFSADAWFCALGAVVGLAAGLLAWKWFHRLGWPVVVLALAAGSLASLVCWQVGELLGPRDFEHRMAVARPGAQVPIDFMVHAHSSLLVWPFFAVVPVLLSSSLGHDEEALPRARRRLGMGRGATDAELVAAEATPTATEG